VAAGTEVVGSPAMPVRDFFRQVATLRRLAGERRKAAADKAAERTGQD
jgi:UDP-3-O-[3-hydroxymyristoyl] glucosamine N-acyltransferase